MELQQTAVQRIAQERKEQIEKHGFTAEHDDQHNCGLFVNMANAAIAGNRDHHGWEGADPATADRICAKPEVDRLVLAGALLHAERDRIDRELSRLINTINEKLGLVVYENPSEESKALDPVQVEASYTISTIIDARGKRMMRRVNNGYSGAELATYLHIGYQEILGMVHRGIAPITERIVVTEVVVNAPTT